ncbi:LacI family DNA-binding transcriptional regulator [Cryobacterium sp. Y62]|uniref:LacI family DNA-binding transcriptional regulator n=1 Tax=Cryobacterium sp. Y62 TaxID=2048284 RepID=UPI001304C38F|nr:LacI family DNA-binding transcriptional regulator [Cryobacterium sp. Y62]
MTSDAALASYPVGKWSWEVQVVTSRDVARIAGVSQSTVSRVLNGGLGVKSSTREKVLGALESYTPNAQARAMRTKRTQTIGVVASDITNPYFPQLLEAIHAAASVRNLDIVLWNEHDPNAPIAIAGARSGIVDGVIVTSATTESSAILQLIERKIPTVLINRGLSTILCDQVVSDNIQIGRTAADYLRQSGIAEIGLVLGPNRLLAVVERHEAFIDRLWHLGEIEVPRRWTSRGELTFDAGYSAVRAMFAVKPYPRALFCSNDVLGFGAVSALHSLGLSVSEDVWVIGVDGLAMSGWEVFDLTTIRQPVEEMAAQGLDLLTKRIDGDDSPFVDIRLQTELIVRGSTGNVQVVSALHCQGS